MLVWCASEMLWRANEHTYKFISIPRAKRCETSEKLPCRAIGRFGFGILMNLAVYMGLKPGQ